MDAVRSVLGVFSGVNAATLSGAIDIIVVRHADGSLHCTPFHVRFGKMRLLYAHEQLVSVVVNDEATQLKMKIGSAGEAFFVSTTESAEAVPDYLATSPLPEDNHKLSLLLNGRMTAAEYGEYLASERTPKRKGTLTAEDLKRLEQPPGAELESSALTASLDNYGKKPLHRIPYLQSGGTRSMSATFDGETNRAEFFSDDDELRGGATPRSDSAMGPQQDPWSWGWGDVPHPEKKRRRRRRRQSVDAKQEEKNTDIDGEVMSSFEGSGSEIDNLSSSEGRSSASGGGAHSPVKPGSWFFSWFRDDRKSSKGSKAKTGGEDEDLLITEQMEAILRDMQENDQDSERAIDAMVTNAANQFSDDAHPVSRTEMINTSRRLRRRAKEIAREKEAHAQGNEGVLNAESGQKETPCVSSDDGGMVFELEDTDTGSLSPRIAADHADVHSKGDVHSRGVGGSSTDAPRDSSNSGAGCGRLGASAEAGRGAVESPVDPEKEAQKRFWSRVLGRPVKDSVDAVHDTQHRLIKCMRLGDTNPDMAEDLDLNGADIAFCREALEGEELATFPDRWQAIFDAHRATAEQLSRLETIREDMVFRVGNNYVVPSSLDEIMTPQNLANLGRVMFNLPDSPRPRIDGAKRDDGTFSTAPPSPASPSAPTSPTDAWEPDGEKDDGATDDDDHSASGQMRFKRVDSFYHSADEDLTESAFKSTNSLADSGADVTDDEVSEEDSTTPREIPVRRKRSAYETPKADDEGRFPVPPPNPLPASQPRAIAGGANHGAAHTGVDESNSAGQVDSTGGTSDDVARSLNSSNDSLRIMARNRKSLRPSQEELASLPLHEGANRVRFVVSTRFQGVQELQANIYLWNWNEKIVISDIDGTITRSDALGQVLPWLGKDWSQSGVASLYTRVVRNGYKIVYLSSRAIGQITSTKKYLKWVSQHDVQLPDGPVLMSPDRLLASAWREVVERKPEQFKIACLESLRQCFPPEVNPFMAGFGNRHTDVISYRAVNVPEGRIFIINPAGEIAVDIINGYKSSYGLLTSLVHEVFPAINTGEGKVAVDDKYCDHNYWAAPVDAFSFSDDP